jgi:hypothetical protein
MQQDPRGLAITTESRAAARHLDAAMLAFLAQRTDVESLLSRALLADPSLVAGHCFLGFTKLLAARRPLAEAAGSDLAAARRGIAERGATRREQALVDALAAWQERGDMWGAAEILDAWLLSRPLDLLALRLSHAIRFMLGDAPGMRITLEAVLPAWGRGVPGRGFVLGCYAFALEETGDLAAAEHVGRGAVALEPSDVWGAHAVTHVMEEQNRAEEGLSWLDVVEPRLAGIGGLRRHLFWHRALFHLRLHETEEALALYDSRVRGEPSEEVRDVMNAASLLWRLQERGVPVGGRRWEELADLALSRIGDHAWAFADLHYVLCLAAAGRAEAVQDMLASIRQRMLRQADSQALVHARVGFTAARAVAAAGLGGPAERIREILLPVHDKLRQLGGSNVQRDLLRRMGTGAPFIPRPMHGADIGRMPAAVAR